MSFRYAKMAFLTLSIMASLVSSAWAGRAISNEEGKYDGRYTAVLEDNNTKERSDEYSATLEGNFLTVQYPEGETVYKISDLYDRSTELEGSVYNSKTKCYMTVHLDDNSHFLHKKSKPERAKKKKRSAKAKTADTSATSAEAPKTDN